MNTRFLLLSLAILSAPMATRADEGTTAAQRLLAHIESAKKEAAKQKPELLAELKAMEDGRINKRLSRDYDTAMYRGRMIYVWQSQFAKTKAIDAKKAEIAKLDDVKEMVPYLDHRLKLGDVGRMPMARFVVRQVVDENNALIEWTTFLFGSHYNPDGSITNTSNEASVLFWLVGSTVGMTDGSKARLEEVYEVIGTKQYATAAGSTKTVFQLKPFDTGKLLIGK